MKKNVGILIPSMNSGGAERVVSRLSGILSDDYNIFIILFEDTYKKFRCDGTVINLNIKALENNNFKKIFLPFKRSFKLKKIKKEYKLEVVISFMDSPNIVNILSHVNGCKTIISIRNYNFNTNNRELLNKIIKYLYGKTDYVVSVSKVITEKMINEFKIKSNKIFTIYNPYNIEQIKKLKSEELDNEYEDFFKEGFIFISVGRRTYQKGFWHLIKAFKMVHERNPNTKLIIVGRDDQKGKTEKLAHDFKIDNNVLFTGFCENPFKYISKSHVYILSSLYEGFPNAMVEAMACGCPVIAADCKSGPREILYENPDLNAICNSIEKADCGILVAPLDSEEDWDCLNYTDSEKNLSDAMIMFLEDTSLCKYYSDKAEKRAELFTYERCKQGFKEVIG